MDSNRDIPSDIELSILLKLPSKTLLKFMSVSKSWYSSIKNPKFIASHLNHHKSPSRHPDNDLINYAKVHTRSEFAWPSAYVYSNRGWNKVSIPNKTVFSQVIHFSNYCFLNETMHWVVRRRNGDALEGSIVTFDPKTESFGEIMFPEISSYKLVLVLELTVINNSVAVVELLIHKHVVIVWKMDAENKAWKPLYTINKSSDMKLLVVNRLFPRMFRKHREEIIITQTSGRMIVFNNNNVDSENSGVYEGAYAMTSGEAYSFTESLLLLH